MDNKKVTTSKNNLSVISLTGRFLGLENSIRFSDALFHLFPQHSLHFLSFIILTIFLKSIFKRWNNLF